ncbi:MAG TPA: carboxypeptidase-like regulatory domain-containing protein [Candidatus Saccharimonadales bacterium]|nr:carboxypeptidase-like regulatory domain-containing protein [Candidatus Saccharimonadales bacterium]
MSIMARIVRIWGALQRGKWLLATFICAMSLATSPVAFAIPTETTGDIAGRITDQNGAGLSGIKVDVYIPDSNAPGVGFALSNPDGTYDIGGLAPGGYNVQFNNMPTSTEAGAYYTAQQWYNLQPSSGTPDTVMVAAGTTTSGINSILSSAGAISGRVIDQDGNGVSDIKIAAYPSLADYDNPDSPLWASFVFTDDSGYYFMGGLPASSTYILDFNGPNSNPYHLEQFYSGKTTAATADPVAVINNATTANINILMPTLGVITGTVTDTTGRPAHAYVSAYATADDFYNNAPTASASVNTDGSYALNDVPSGTYYLYFTPLPGYLYVSQFYDNQPTIGTAALVTATKGVTTPSIDVTLTFLSQTTGGLEAHSNKFQPACMGPIRDVLPGICQAAFAGLPTTAKASVNIHNKNQGPTGGVTFTSEAAGHTLKLTSRNISQFYVFGASNATAAAQGTATVTVDGITTTNTFRVVATDGKLLNPQTNDQFGIFIWAPGANPDTDQPLYFMNEPLANGNVRILG